MNQLIDVAKAGDPGGTFRSVLSNFASGVVVVTGSLDGQPYGLACQSFFSVSLNPPLIAISPSVRSGSWRRIARTGSFAISILGESQRDLCMTFGRGGRQDKFASAGWEPGPSGSPLIHGCIAWLDCSVHAVHSAGDHHLVLGEVKHVMIGRQSEQPLVFFRSQFSNITQPRRTATDWGADDLWGSAPWIEGIDL